MTIDWKNWKPYLCHVNGKPASIVVDFETRKMAPIGAKPWLRWAWVHFQFPQPDDLSSSNEEPILYQIEYSLCAEVSEAGSALPCGRISTKGRREFYYHGETDEGFHSPLRLR